MKICNYLIWNNVLFNLIGFLLFNGVIVGYLLVEIKLNKSSEVDMMISFLVIILEFWLVMDYGYDGNVGIN